MAKKREEYGGSVYDQQYFTDDELRSAAEIRAAAEAGDTSWDDAHQYVESIRNKYGYGGGQDGSNYQVVRAQDSAPTYTSPYQTQIDALYNKLLNREPFSYDYASDPTYQQYEKAYTRNGQRAMQDALAQISARTGGLASSYAGTAAQQTYGRYMSELADQIPALRQAAYAMYKDEGDQLRDNLSTLLGMENTKYGRYQDALSQYNYAAELQNALENQRYERSRAAEQEQYERELALAQLAASVGDYSGYDRLGITPNWDNVAAATTAGSASLLKGSGGGGGGGGRSSGGGGTTAGDGATTEDDFWQTVSDYAALGGDPADYIKANWKNTGLFSSQTAALSAWNVYNTQNKQSNTTVEGGWNKDEPFKNPLAPGGRNPSAGNTSSTANNAGIPQRYLDEINDDAEGGMSVENLAAKLERWVNEKKITAAQADWIAASFGY